ncbi:hypothetical protein IHE45_09G056100 [Dioscorea alata]|uniref:Uncharacterized protein n=1 Tax=Dioscorea alata TaxID=55571 RepID=A0ACB7VFA2_DIOAL|nr:hypothetical protein IHE45_09G056100 [Dioscorea alata]
MREDGSILKFKKGIHAKDITAMYEGYRLVRCSSERTVMPGKAELECGRLYFLVLKNSARSKETYEKMLNVCESKGMMQRGTHRREDKEGGDLAKRSISSVHSINSSEIIKRCDSWVPELKTIPEIASPPAV